VDQNPYRSPTPDVRHGGSTFLEVSAIACWGFCFVWSLIGVCAAVAGLETFKERPYGVVTVLICIFAFPIVGAALLGMAIGRRSVSLAIYGLLLLAAAPILFAIRLNFGTL
jgi:hypothetical protein